MATTSAIQLKKETNKWDDGANPTILTCNGTKGPCQEPENYLKKNQVRAGKRVTEGQPGWAAQEAADQAAKNARFANPTTL